MWKMRAVQNSQKYVHKHIRSVCMRMDKHEHEHKMNAYKMTTIVVNTVLADSEKRLS